jgi:hypothetical protein
MKIVLFNTHHNGDQFFTKEFVRTIVNSNPQHKFYMLSRQFFSLYSDIDNLEIIERPNDIGFDAISVDISKKYYIKDDTIYINAGLGLKTESGNKWSCMYHMVDCMNNWFNEIINEINTLQIEPKLIFNRLIKDNILPAASIFKNIKFYELPKQVKLFLKNPCIFYYNLKPLSLPEIVVDDDTIIELLAKKYPIYNIIVAKETTKKMNNILSLSDINIKESPDGKNLLLYAYIASFCSIIITKDTGGGQIIFNRFTAESNNRQYFIYMYPESHNQTYLTYGKIPYTEYLQNIFTKENKHMILLNKYDPEIIMAEVEKIGSITAAKLPPDTQSGGKMHRLYKRTYKNKINKRKKSYKNNKRVKSKI